MKKLLIVVAVLEAVVLLGLLFSRLRADAAALRVSVPAAHADPARDAETAVVAPSPEGPGASRPTRGALTAGSDEPAATDSDDGLGILLFGRITDDQGKAVTSGSVYATTGRADEDSSVTVRSDGGYCLTGLRAGRWRLYVRSEGLVDLEPWVLLPPAPRTQRLDLVLQRSWPLKVKLVTPDGQPLYELMRAAQERRELDHSATDGLTALATLEPLPPGPLADPPTHRRERETLGTWQHGHGSHDMKELPKEYAGTLLLRRPPPCCVSALLEHVVLATESVAAGAEEVTLRVSLDEVLRLAATVRAQLVDKSGGMPLSGMSATFLPLGIWGSGGNKSDAEGRVEFKGIMPGWRQLHVMGKDLEPVQRKVLVQPGRELDLGAIPMGRGLSVELQVVDAQGTPVPAMLHCALLGSADSDWGQNLSLSTDAEGKAKVTMAPRGRILIRTQPRGRGLHGWVVVDTTHGPVTGARLQLRPAVALRIVNETSEDRGWSVAVRTADDLPIATVELRAPEHEVWVAPGAFQVELRRNGVVQRSSAVTVGEGGAVVRVP